MKITKKYEVQKLKKKLPINLIKLTKSVISCKDGNDRFTSAPVKVLSDEVRIRFLCFCFFKLVISLQQ